MEITKNQMAPEDVADWNLEKERTLSSMRAANEGGVKPVAGFLSITTDGDDAANL